MPFLQPLRGRPTWDLIALIEKKARELGEAKTRYRLRKAYYWRKRADWLSKDLRQLRAEITYRISANCL